jgi:hypothetical protein
MMVNPNRMKCIKKFLRMFFNIADLDCFSASKSPFCVFPKENKMFLIVEQVSLLGRIYILPNLQIKETIMSQHIFQICIFSSFQIQSTKINSAGEGYQL